MRNVKIITDSCADLNAELLERYDIDYAEMKGNARKADLVGKRSTRPLQHYAKRRAHHHHAGSRRGIYESIQKVP